MSARRLRPRAYNRLVITGFFGMVLVLVLFVLCSSAQAVSSQSGGSRVMVIQKKWRIEVRNPAVEGMPTSSPAVRVPDPEAEHRGITVTYVYEVKVRNTGKKAIRKLTWEYVFFEPGTELEVGRRLFESEVSISPGRTRNVIMRSALPPRGSIDARRADKKSRDKYSEQVVIQRVQYADGSVWQATSN